MLAERHKRNKKSFNPVNLLDLSECSYCGKHIARVRVTKDEDSSWRTTVRPCVTCALSTAQRFLDLTLKIVYKTFTVPEVSSSIVASTCVRWCSPRCTASVLESASVTPHGVGGRQQTDKKTNKSISGQPQLSAAETWTGGSSGVLAEGVTAQQLVSRANLLSDDSAFTVCA